MAPRLPITAICEKLFDHNYYLDRNPDVRKQASIEPMMHYLLQGGFESRNPHPLFDSSFYLKNNPNAARQKINPLIHFLTEGVLKGRDPHPLFSTSYYAAQLGDEQYSEHPLFHYLMHGSETHCNPNPLFDNAFYLEQMKLDSSSTGENPLVHYLCNGSSQGLNPSPLFHTNFYLQLHSDVARSGMNPLVHFVLYGKSEGRAHTPTFDLSACSLSQNSSRRNEAVECIVKLNAIEPLIMLPEQLNFLPQLRTPTSVNAGEAYFKLQKALRLPISHVFILGALSHQEEYKIRHQVIESLAKESQQKNHALVITTEASEFKSDGIKSFDLSKVQPDLDRHDAAHVLLRLILQARPQMTFICNSMAGLEMLSKYGRQAASASRRIVWIQSDTCDGTDPEDLHKISDTIDNLSTSSLLDYANVAAGNQGAV